MDMETETIQKLSKDLKKAAAAMSSQEARFLVDDYYQIQHFRMALANQSRSMDTSGEPHDYHSYQLKNFEIQERQIKTALDIYTSNHFIGVWLKSIQGIGPVIAAGLLAYIDITKCPTAGHIWSFAGLLPEQKWEKGQKRPWNATLKTLCWKAGQSFVKVSGSDKDIYGHLFREKKQYYIDKNERGEFAERAAQCLKAKKYGKETEAYKAYNAGRLPAGHIEAMAERWAVKLFLSHLHYVWYRYAHHGEEPPKPFVQAILGHAHIIQPPNLEMLEEALQENQTH